MIVLITTVFLAYGLIVIRLSQGIGQVETTRLRARHAQQDFSVVVPFRNEQEHLPELLESFKELDYPRDKFEVLLVDDNSEDDSAVVVEQFRAENPELKLLLLHNDNQEGSPKKRAIEKAIDKATHPWIVTTDADCRFGRKWLKAFDQLIEDKAPEMIVGPVSYDRAENFLQRFQLLDFLSLQGTTLGSFGWQSRSTWVQPFMCNGANLAYRKSAFERLGGFQGNEQIASGDDVFLLEKMSTKHPGQVAYLKSQEALVSTVPMSSWPALMHQRVRWASKTTALSNSFGKIIGILVLLVNFALLALTPLAMTGQFPWSALGLLFLLKFNVDFLLIYRTAELFNQQKAMRAYFMSSLIYPLFSVVVGLWSLTGRYRWKGRQF